VVKLAIKEVSSLQLTMVGYNRRIKKYNWVIIDEYNGSKKPCTIKCLKCGNIRHVGEAGHICGHKCEKCNTNPKNYTKERFNKKIARYNWIVEGEFNGTKKPCSVKCLKCGNVDNINQAIYAYQHKCFTCDSGRQKQKQKITERINKKLDKKNFVLVSEYKKSKSPIDIKCKKCGTIRTLKQANYVNYFLECTNCCKHVCFQCGKEFVITTKKDRKFCYDCAPVDEFGLAHAKAKNAYKKKLIMERYGSSCIKCGYNKCFNALEFHHLNPDDKDKEMTPCTLIRLCKNIEDTFPELDRCQLVCANCHREIHAKINRDKRKLLNKEAHV
jgi:hypothetical protein